MKKTGKLIRLVHNPTAGEGDYSRAHITRLLAAHGYRCTYSSSKEKMLKSISPETEFIAIAGGDGTIRKTVMKLLNKKLKYKRPIALLPFGTANNIATSLNIPSDNNRNIRSWAEYNLKKFDVGQVTGLRETHYFIESFGFGIFPKLMRVLDKMNTNQIDTAAQEFQLALDTLLKLSRKYKPVPFNMQINGQTITGKAILIEIMNISCLGPNLKLSPGADSEDGFFDVVIVTEKDRNKLEDFITAKTSSKEPIFPIKPIQTKSLTISWAGKHLHADDQVIKENCPEGLKISLLDSLLEMVTPS